MGTPGTGVIGEDGRAMLLPGGSAALVDAGGGSCCCNPIIVQHGANCPMTFWSIGDERSFYIYYNELHNNLNGFPPPQVVDVYDSKVHRTMTLTEIYPSGNGSKRTYKFEVCEFIDDAKWTTFDELIELPSDGSPFWGPFGSPSHFSPPYRSEMFAGNRASWAELNILALDFGPVWAVDDFNPEVETSYRYSQGPGFNNDSPGLPFQAIYGDLFHHQTITDAADSRFSKRMVRFDPLEPFEWMEVEVTSSPSSFGIFNAPGSIQFDDVTIDFNEKGGFNGWGKTLKVRLTYISPGYFQVDRWVENVLIAPFTDFRQTIIGTPPGFLRLRNVGPIQKDAPYCIGYGFKGLFANGLQGFTRLHLRTSNPDKVCIQPTGGSGAGDPGPPTFFAYDPNEWLALVEGTLATISPTVVGGNQPFDFQNLQTAFTRMPSGMSVDPLTGVVTGTPDLSDNVITATAKIRLTDALGFQKEAQNNWLVTPNPNPPVTLSYPEYGTPPILPRTAHWFFVNGDLESVSPVVTDGATPYAFSIDSGSLPAGITRDALTGVVSGTATSNGTGSVDIRILDNDNEEATTGTITWEVVAGGPGA